MGGKVSSPFDEAKYKALLEGLEISVLKLSELENGIRIDAELYEKEYIRIENLLKSVDYKILGREAAMVKKGIFNINSSFFTDKGIPFVRISNLKNMVIDDNDIVYIPKEENDKNLSTFLNRSDIILSKTAYPAASLVTLDNCNTSQDTVAIKLKDSSTLISHYVVTFFNTYYGLKQMRRWFTGNIQMHLNLTDSKEMIIPYFSNDFQVFIKNIFEKGLKAKETSQNLYTTAEAELLAALGLSDYQPSTENVQVKSLKDSFLNSGRLDAEYYQPRYEEMVAEAKQYIKEWKTIKEACYLFDNNFVPKEAENYKYIELSNIGVTGDITGHTFNNGKKLPSRARRIVKTGNVIISSIEGSLQKCGLITDKYDNAICSTGFYVLNSNDLNSETLLVLFKSELMQEIMKQNCSGTILTSMNKDDFLQIKIPIFDDSFQTQISNAIQRSFKLKTQSKQLLHIAKTGVEKAIESSEAEAMAWMENEIANLENL